MALSRSSFCTFLVEGWGARIFRPEIFPGFPFVPVHWRALAFNRDIVGHDRLPRNVWHHLLQGLADSTGESVAFVASPQPITRGIVAEREQPFVVPLTESDVIAYFSNMDMYLPEFFMVGVSERWAVWGDSDLTVLGGESNVISPLIRQLGGERKIIEEAAREFGLGDAAGDAHMWAYLRGLVDRAENREDGKDQAESR